LKVKFQSHTSGACKFFRATQPANYLDYATVEDEWDSDTSADLTVICRAVHEEVYHCMKYLQREGKKVLYEWDDYFFDISKYNPAKGAYTEKELNMTNAFLYEADGVICSTNYLAKLTKKHTSKPIYVLPNGIDMAKYDKIAALKKPHDTINIGYMGSATHLADIYGTECWRAIILIMNEFKNVRLVLKGYDFTQTDYFNHLRDRIDILEGGDDYQIDMLKFDIGLAPLQDTDFNRAKSNLKFLEYSALGIPTVASRVKAYKCINHNITGMLVDNKLTYWYLALKELVTNEMTRKRLAFNANAYVRKTFDAPLIATKYTEVFKEVLSV